MALIFSCGKSSPITPVDDEKTRAVGRPITLATPSVTVATAASPCLPVKALELPEFTTIAAPAPADTFAASLACQVMEWGFDGVLLNTAVALAQDPVAMAVAFADAVRAGHSARRAGAMQPQASAQPSTPVLGTPFWHHAPA